MKKLLFLLAFLVFACTTEETTPDVTAPAITLTGDNPQIVNLNENYTELGATANDDTDGNISNQIAITSNVNISKEDTYIVIYSVSDKAGNETTITREVIVRDPNPIYLDTNGITVKARDWAEVGMKGTLDGKQYTIVNKETLESMIENNEDVTAVCTTKITDMSYLFYNADTFNQDIGNWDVSNVTNMDRMFYFSKVFNQNIDNWDVSKVTNMLGLFLGANAFNQDIGNWNVSNVTNMYAMFEGAKSFNQNIGIWDVINVTNMDRMFFQAEAFNQDIGSWNVSKVTNMIYMFTKATDFNQNLTGWCVNNITEEPTGFANLSSLESSNYPIWGSCAN